MVNDFTVNPYFQNGAPPFVNVRGLCWNLSDSSVRRILSRTWATATKEIHRDLPKDKVKNAVRTNYYKG